MSFPAHVKGRARFLLGRKWGLASAVARQKLRMERGPDWRTQRMRALHDAKGITLREGCTIRATGATHWLLRRSVAGRVNQVDLLIDGTLFRTGSLRSALSAIRWHKWPMVQWRVAA